jgi:hypothetical protein
LIPVLVFFAHAIFAVWAFAKSYQTDGIVQAFLNVFFIVILFTVGWTISDLLVGFIVSDVGYEILLPTNGLSMFFLKLTGFIKVYGNGYGRLTPKDSVSLLFLTTIEIFFYRFYFKQTSMK